MLITQSHGDDFILEPTRENVECTGPDGLCHWDRYMCIEEGMGKVEYWDTGGDDGSIIRKVKVTDYHRKEQHHVFYIHFGAEWVAFKAAMSQLLKLT